MDLRTVIIVLIVLLAIGLIAYIQLDSKKNKDKNKKVNKGMHENKNDEESVKVKANTSTKDFKNTPRKDILDFMKFDKVEDNMIQINNGDKYVMVLQCQGINFYLMSEAEQLAVEQGFIQLLNTLRFPIQLYTQTRRIDLEESIKQYRERVERVRDEVNELANTIDSYEKSKNVSDKYINKMQTELIKKERILDYSSDVTESIVNISTNKSVLQRKFYVVIPYFITELGIANVFKDEEKKELAYAELYTRARTIASSLSTCSIACKVLDSSELGELLYIAYNRDDSSILDLRKSMESGFYRLYSTSKDILEKKEDYIDRQVEDIALKRAEQAIMAAGQMLMSEREIKEKYPKEIAEVTDQILENSRVNYSEEIIDTALDIMRNAPIRRAIKRKKTNNTNDKTPAISEAKKEVS